MRHFRRPTPRILLYGVLTFLLVASVLVWAFERTTSWANDWLPNFIAEWSGIFIAVLVVDRLVYAERQREQAAIYTPLRHTAGLALGKALQPLIDFLLAVAEATGLRTRPGQDLVTFFEELFEAFPRGGIVDPRACLEQWVEILTKVESDLRGVRDRYVVTLDPGEISELDKLIAAVVPYPWLLNERRTERESEAVTTMMKPTIYTATRPLRYLSLSFEDMVGAPLTTGPWHVSPEQHVSWRSMPEIWERVRDDERQRLLWTRVRMPPPSHSGDAARL